MKEDSGVSDSVLSLPSGGGGISALGERFQPDLSRGSGNYAIPINCPRGPNDLRPSLSLTYSTGAGNSPFGLGWRFGTTRIERRCDRGIPSFTDSDTFVFGGADILVPVGANRYRLKTDTKFWFIERQDPGWKVRTGDGKTMLFGQIAASQEVGPAGVFAWCLDQEIDAAGNIVQYSYRLDEGRLYLDAISYSIFRLQIAYEPRPDFLRSGRAGFAQNMGLRATAIELHCARLNPTLLRTYALSYVQAGNGASLLKGVKLTATADGQEASFPPLSFTYSDLDLSQWKVQELQAFVPPPSLDDPSAQLVDMNGDGIPDVLQTTGGTAFLWENGGDGWLNGPVRMEGTPSTLQLSQDNVALADLDGDGRADLFAVDQPLSVFFHGNGRGSFDSLPTVFAQAPTLQLASPQTRLVDLDGDGITDLMATGPNALLLYHFEPETGWSDPQAVDRISDLEQFPDVSFADRGIRLGDMTGDGLSDFVSVYSGNVSYWPSLGNGHWGGRVAMSSSPVFPSGYRDEQVYLTDIDGDGCADVIYVDSTSITIWLNQNGRGFAPPAVIPIAPRSQTGRILFADPFGDGRASLLWSDSPSVDFGTGYRVLRLGGETAPYLMTAINNGMGGMLEMEYSTSTAMRISDLKANRPWTSQLPFVSQVVSKTRERDTVTGRVSENSIHYHDGVWDGPQREFRGYKSVTVELNGDESVPRVRQEVQFFQGDPDAVDLIDRENQRALAGSLTSIAKFEFTESGERLREESTQTWEVRQEFTDGKKFVFFPHITQIETREHALTGTADRTERTMLLDYDGHGNALRRVRESLAEGDAQEKWIRSEARYTYCNDENRWLIKLPVRLEMREGPGGRPAGAKIHFYDGPAFVGLPEGQATAGLLTRTSDLQLINALLPADYIGGRDFSALGFEPSGNGDMAGFYVNSFAAKRDARGNVIERLDPSNSLQMIMDDDGVYPSRTIDSGGNTTQYLFNPRSGEPSRITTPDNRIVQHDFDAIGRLIAMSETDDDGVLQLTNAWSLDLGNLPASATSISPNSPGRTRAELLAVDPTTLADVSLSRLIYDGFANRLQQLVTAPSADDGTSRFVVTQNVRLNARGQVGAKFPNTFVTNLNYQPVGPGSTPLTSYKFDSQGSLIETTGPGSAFHRVQRDAFTVTHFEEPGTAVPVRIETFDARTRLVRVEEFRGDGRSCITSYDLALDGRIAAVRNGAGSVIASYTIAGPAETIRIQHRDAGSRTFYRNAAGRVVERVDSDGTKIQFDYDGVGRMVSSKASKSGGAPVVIRELHYDTDPDGVSDGRFLQGRIALAVEGGNRFHYSYNHAGSLVQQDISVDGVTLSTKHEYDFQGRQIAIVYPDGHRKTYTRDKSGGIRSIPGIVEAISYDEEIGFSNYQLSNGVMVESLRDPASRRLSWIAASKAGVLLRSVDFSYDNTGRIVGTRDEIPGDIEKSAFHYDGMSRLTAFEVRRDTEAGALLRGGSYQYDDESNLTAFNETAPLLFTYGDATRPGLLTSFNNGAPSPVTYDARGQTTSVGELSAIEYDFFDRVRRIVKKDGTELLFAYDPQSRRIFKQVTNGGTVSKVRYVTGVYEQHDGFAIRNVYLQNLILASERVEAGTVKAAASYLNDHHGTVLLATDSGGVPIHQQRYMPFGSTVLSDALDRYLGREADTETGLLQFGARYFAPALGRFLTPDWFVLENPVKPMRVPQAYNVYAYALNNPLSFKDPSGLWFGIDDLIVAAVGFVVGFVTGLIYGLANGQGWSSFLTALETGLTTAAGAWLGWNTGFLVGGPVLGVIGAVMGGFNGLWSGVHGIYDWTSVEGWFSFISDSTWGLLGTSLGNLVTVINLCIPGSNYREDLSHRQNRNVWEGGFYLKKEDAFTQGNVISNIGTGTSSIDMDLLNKHETLHIWQNRIFGPIFQVVYIAWFIVGGLVGVVIGLFHPSEFGSIVETAAYDDNPWEYWAYKNQNNWPPAGSNPIDRW
jgi:RHS repeat-associated protein